VNRLPPKPPSILRQLRKLGPLSFSQESLWFLYQFDPSNLAYNSTYLFRLKGGIDHDILEHALNEIVRRHEILRTIYPNRGGQPLQAINPYEPFSLNEFDFSSGPEDEIELVVTKFALEHGKAPVNLHRGPLTRFALLHVSSKEDYLFFATHHISFDAWSRQVLIGELVQLYDAYRLGKNPDMPEFAGTVS
jgi:NRPS condensation-like uncharacterized protein